MGVDQRRCLHPGLSCFASSTVAWLYLPVSLCVRGAPSTSRSSCFATCSKYSAARLTGQPSTMTIERFLARSPPRSPAGCGTTQFPSPTRSRTHSRPVPRSSARSRTMPTIGNDACSSKNSSKPSRSTPTASKPPLPERHQLLVNLNEVGSRDPGTGSVVSEDRTKRRTIPSRNLLAFIGYWLTVGSGFSLIIATDNPNSGSTSVACQGSYQVVVANQPPTAKT